MRNPCLEFPPTGDHCKLAGIPKTTTICRDCFFRFIYEQTILSPDAIQVEFLSDQAVLVKGGTVVIVRATGFITEPPDVKELCLPPAKHKDPCKFPGCHELVGKTGYCHRHYNLIESRRRAGWPAELIFEPPNYRGKKSSEMKWGEI